MSGSVRAKYGGKTTVAINRAIRAEFRAGGVALDQLTEAQHAMMAGGGEAAQDKYDRLLREVQSMEDVIRKRYGMPARSATPDRTRSAGRRRGGKGDGATRPTSTKKARPKGEGLEGVALGDGLVSIHAPGGANRQKSELSRSDASIHAGLPATAGVSLGRPSVSNQFAAPSAGSWTPSAAVVARMGKEPDAVLAAECKVAERTIRAARDRLGIAASTAAEEAFDGARLRAARKAAGLTLDALATKAGVGGGKAYLSQLESDKREPTRQTRERLAEALGVTVGELAKGDDDPTTPAAKLEDHAAQGALREAIRRRMRERGLANVRQLAGLLATSRPASLYRLMGGASRVDVALVDDLMQALDLLRD